MRIEPFKSLLSCFLRGYAFGCENTCLHIDNKSISYAEMARNVCAVLSVLEEVDDDHCVAGVYVGREEGLFTGMLSVLSWEKGYVPISPDFPEERCVDLIKTSQLQTIFTTQKYADALLNLLSTNQLKCHVVVLGAEAKDVHNAKNSIIHVNFSKVLDAEDTCLNEPAVLPSELAYLIFTSGSTGKPKGVPITHLNAVQFVERMQDRYELTPLDRVIYLPDFYFDLSIYPIWLTWNAGAAIFVPSEREKILAANFVKEHEISVWCSVPSSITFLKKFKLLEEDAFPSIRTSVFCGEPLLKEQARQWIRACPNSIFDNFYGPTEVTVFSTVFRFDNETLEFGEGDVTSIGKPFAGVGVCIVNEANAPVAPGEVGELCLSGLQVAMGYWEDPGLTEEKFGPISAKLGPFANRWYRTGDMVYMADCEKMMFKGRVDDQVKVMGYRIELGEIEQAVRKMAGIEAVAAVFCEDAHSVTEVISLFVSGANLNEIDVRKNIEERLPKYMVPKNIMLLDELPINKNGKVDKEELKRILQQDANHD